MIRYQNHLDNCVSNDRIIAMFRIYCTADRFRGMRRHWLMVHYHYIQLYVVRYKFSLLGRCYTCRVKEARKAHQFLYEMMTLLQTHYQITTTHSTIDRDDKIRNQIRVSLCDKLRYHVPLR